MTSTFTNSELQGKRNENVKVWPSEVHLEQNKRIKEKPLLKEIVCVFTQYGRKHNILYNHPKKIKQHK